MKKSTTIISLLITIIITSAIYFTFYRDVHLTAGLKVKYDKNEIKQKAQKLVSELNIPVNGYRISTKLESNNGLIKQTEEMFGHKKGNDLLRNYLPGYYWKVTWVSLNSSNISISSGSENEKQNSKPFIEVHYNNNGNLLELRWAINDSTALPAVSSLQAGEKLEKFLSRFGTVIKQSNNTIKNDTVKPFDISFITYSNDTLNFVSEKKIELLRRTDYQYSWEGNSSLLNDKINMELTVSGKDISNFKLNYKIPEKYTENNSGIYQTSLNIIFYFIMIILIGIFAYKKIKAYEIGFRLAFILTILVSVTFGLNIYNSISEPLGWIILLPVGFGVLFYGGSFLITWAVSETITREVWKEKFLSLDLLTKGSINHSKVGTSIYNGLSAGFLLTVIWLILLFIVQSFTSIWNASYDNILLSSINSSSPALQILFKNIPSSFFLCAVFFNFTFTGMRKKFNSIAFLLIFIGIFWGFVNSNGIYPLYLGIIIEIIIGITLVAIYYKFDILTTAIALISFQSITSGLSLFSTGHITYIDSGYFLIGIFVVILAWATYALLSKDENVELEKLTPAFVENITERQRLQRELEIARDVQTSFLPRKDPEFPGIEIVSKCLPAFEVGGDYYDFIIHSENKIGIIVGDVSGKGTQAAFYMTLTKGFLKALANKYDSPSGFLSEMNILFYENVERGTFISMIYGIFDIKEKTLTLARAGHNPVLVKKSEIGNIDVLNPTGMALGLEKGNVFKQTIKEVKIDVEPGDIFVFYTDGFTEAMNKKKEEYGEDNLINSIESNGNLSADELCRKIFSDVSTFTKKAQQHDDMTLVVAKIKN